MEAVIRSAASAAHRKTKSRGPRYREASQPAGVRLSSRRPDASLNLGPPNLFYLEAAEAAGLIMVSKSLQKGCKVK